MKMIFQVCIETRDATQEEVCEALDLALQVLDMPNGDTLEPDSISIEYSETKTPNDQDTRPEGCLPPKGPC